MNIAKKDIQRDLLFQVIWNIRKQKLTLSGAKRLAKAFVRILQITEGEGLVCQVCLLSKLYKEARPVCIKYGRLVDEDKRMNRIPAASDQIQQGAIENALSILKGGVLYG